MEMIRGGNGPILSADPFLPRIACGGVRFDAIVRTQALRFLAGREAARFRSMRRNWLSVFVFVLALTIQVIAPAGANVAMARASGEAQQSVSICLSIGGDPADNSQQFPGHNDRHHSSCLLCQVCCGGIAPIEARPHQVGKAPVQWIVLAWTVADRVLPAPRHKHSHQARAPPAFS